MTQDRHSTGQASRQRAARAPVRGSAFGADMSRGAAFRASGGGQQSAFGLQQRMQIPAAMDISGLLAAPAPTATLAAEPTGVGPHLLAGRLCRSGAEKRRPSHGPHDLHVSAHLSTTS